MILSQCRPSHNGCGRLWPGHLALLFLLLGSAGVVKGEETKQPAPDAEQIRQFRLQLHQASQHFKAGQLAYDQAIQAYLAAYQIHPTPLLLFNIAQIHRQAGRRQEALQYYERCLRENPTSELSARVQRYVAELQEALQPAVPASSVGSSASDGFQGTQQERLAQFRANIDGAAKSYQAGDFAQAAKSYWAAYSLKPQPIILFDIAQTYRNAGDLSQALTLYQRFLREEPDSPSVPDALGYIEELKGRLSKQQAEQAKRAEMERANARLGQAAQVLSERLARIEQIQKQPKPLYRRGWFWGVLAGGAAAIGLSIGLTVGLAPHLPASDFGNRTVSF